MSFSCPWSLLRSAFLLHAASYQCWHVWWMNTGQDPLKPPGALHTIRHRTNPMARHEKAHNAPRHNVSQSDWRWWALDPPVRSGHKVQFQDLSQSPRSRNNSTPTGSGNSCPGLCAMRNNAGPAALRAVRDTQVTAYIRHPRRRIPGPCSLNWTATCWWSEWMSGICIVFQPKKGSYVEIFFIALPAGKWFILPLTMQ